MVGSSISTNISLVHVHGATLSDNTVASYELASVVDPNSSHILNTALSNNINCLITSTNEHAQACAKSDNDST